MKGRVCTREKCPKCWGDFKEVISERSNKVSLDMICPKCLTHPRLFYIFLYLPKQHCPDPRKRDLKISRTDDGDLLTNYGKAYRLLEHIRKEIDDGVFAVENYRQRDVAAFQGGTLFPKWLETKADKSPTHFRELKRYQRLYFLPYFEKQDMRKINTGHIEDFMAWLNVRQGELGYKQLSSKTKKNILMALAAFCRWMNRRGSLKALPEFPKISPPSPVINWISKEDQLKILDAIPEQHQPIFLFMMYHPIRPGEARALKVKDINLELSSVHICRAWSGREIRPRKNGKDYYLPLSSTFDPSLMKDKHPEAWLFTTPKQGRVYTHDYLAKIWRQAFQTKGLRYISIKNATRHSVASQALNRGVRIEAISKALGHSDLKITLDRYAKMEVETLREVIDEGPNVRLLTINRDSS